MDLIHLKVVKFLIRIPVRYATSFLMIQMVLIVLFHILVLVGLIPFQFVWGGRIENREQLIVMELISFVGNAFLFWIVGQKSGQFQKRWGEKALRAAFYMMSLLFALNTLGNAVAIHPFEKYFFGFLTLLSSLLCLRLALKED